MKKRRKANSIDLSFVWNPLSLIVILARVASALYILVSPVWGYIWTVLFDYIDAIVFLHVQGISRRQYHYVDKNLDFVYFAVMLVVDSKYGLFIPLSLLLLYRLIGQYLYLQTHKITTFIFFP